MSLPKVLQPKGKKKAESGPDEVTFTENELPPVGKLAPKKKKAAAPPAPDQDDEDEKPKGGGTDLVAP